MVRRIASPGLVQEEFVFVMVMVIVASQPHTAILTPELVRMEVTDKVAGLMESAVQEIVRAMFVFQHVGILVIAE
jgi:hypothetical protein